MNRKHQKYAWAVVGAGPGGITAVGLLLDAGVDAEKILWIDSEFQVGDFGKYWGEVNSNTQVSLFQKYLHGVSHFEYGNKTESFVLDDMDPNGFTMLKNMVDPMRWVTAVLRKKVFSITGWVDAITMELGSWNLCTKNGNFYAEKVILATGSEAKSLYYPDIEKIDLRLALSPSLLKTVCHDNDTVGVFGGSHSAMIIIRNLVEAGVKNIINFYLSPLRYAVAMQDWILYDDIGLKGETAKWVRENLAAYHLPQVKRYLSTSNHIHEQLPKCNKVIYAIGFAPRQIPITDVSFTDYDETNGIIVPGLFGVGIGFPIAVTDPFGRKERNVGLWKFLKNTKRLLPLWQQYSLY